MILVVVLILAVHTLAQNETQFIYNGFQGSINKLHVDGIATILPNGLFNPSTNGNSSNHIGAVELDTVQNAYFNDIDGNHVGIDVNSLESVDAASAAYYYDKEKVNKTLLLTSGKPMQVWIEYDEVEMLLSVTLSPLSYPKPSKCLLSKHLNLSSILLHSIKKFEELLEPWEKEYAPHRYSYKELYVATKGCKNSELLGVGGFGKVYKGVLPAINRQVAVKRVSHDSRQGMKEFVAEISSLRRLRHRNLVQLLGYCRRKGELLLVYEYMPNGSLDKFLLDKDGVASALLYLHEEWEQVVLHRDVKASNVLLDAEMNTRLGDFGLARLCDHNNDPRTTHVIGTIGYIAPEVSRTQKPATSSDVFAFGMFLLDVGCGRRPTDKQSDNDAEDFFLSDWAYDCWKRGNILMASDPTLEGNYQEKEMELILKLGLLCLHPKAAERPTMRHAVMFLDGSATLPDIPSEYDTESGVYFGEVWGNSGSYPSSSGTVSLGLMSSSNSVLQHGR
uniref:non-specific serine/threonine protein kinase n=1 Tax=Chenopodium quinoa TaxID=63459 RepID=A0A803M989_CHEQI